MSETAHASNLADEVAGLRRALREFLDRLGPANPNGDLTIADWCRKRRISRAKFYLMRKAGTAPRVTKFDGLYRVTPEADREWELARQAETAT